MNVSKKNQVGSEKIYVESRSYREKGYEISFSENKILIHLTLHFNMLDSERKQLAVDSRISQEMFDHVDGCLSLMAEVWGRYNIDFKLNLLLEGQEFNIEDQSTRIIHDVDLVYDTGRSNIYTYYYLSEPGHNLCKLMLHETGHNLGLNDEYFEPGRSNTDAKEQWPFSIMEHHGADWDKIDFMPRHIKKILEPVCS